MRYEILTSKATKRSIGNLFIEKWWNVVSLKKRFEVCSIFQRQNITKTIILDFFQQYDTDGDMIMSKDELERMRKSLEQLGDFQASSVQLGQKGMWLIRFRFLPIFMNQYHKFHMIHMIW